MQATPTQTFVPIKEIRDGIIMTTDTEMRAILIASSLNLSLKSDDEQHAVISGFQTFLNSLEFPCQIFVQSRRLDIRPYVSMLEDRAKNVTEDLLKVQIREYIEFIKNFTDTRNIMTKNFYVVVPYSMPLVGGGNILKSSTKEESKQLKIEQFEEARSQLEQRVSVVSQGLTRVGVRVARLGTEEIVELFYKLFNPGETDKPIITN